MDTSIFTDIQTNYKVNSVDTISLLTARSPQVVAKRWKADGTIAGYDSPKNYSHRTAQVADIRELSAVLTDLEGDPSTMIVRGRYIGDERARPLMGDDKGWQPPYVLRREAVFEDQPLHSLMVDVDGFRPTSADPLTDTVAACVEYISTQLPECFHLCAYHWQLSGSAGHPDHAGLLKAHLWFWLERPYTSAELAAWHKHAALGKRVDASLLRVVQPHYTAGPVSDPGVTIPLRVRSGFVAGWEDVVALDVPAEVLASATTRTGAAPAQDDPVAKRLNELGLVKRQAKDGSLFIDCPRQDQHTGAKTGDTSCIYFPPHTGGFRQGNFKCMHAGCADASQAEFRDALGLTFGSADDFDVLAGASQSEAAEVLIEQLRNETHNQVVDTWARRAAALPATAAALVLAEVHALTGVGRRPLNAELSAARRKTVQRDIGGRTAIEYHPEDTVEQSKQVGRLILEHLDPRELVTFAGGAARIAEVALPFAHLADTDAPPPPQVLIEAHTTASVRALVERVATFHRNGEKAAVPLQAPAPVIENLLLLNPATAPSVSGLLAHPIVTQRGEIIATNGLHESTGLFVHGVGDMSARAYSRQEATEALQRVADTTLEGFEFLSVLDRWVAVAGLFTAIERRVLDCAPGLAILAPSQASGKTTLARMLHVVTTGRDLSVINLPVGNPDEVEKRLLSLLLRSPEMCVFDNITDGLTVNVAAINAAMTAPTFEGRPLGSTAIVSVPTATTFVVTGNNLRLGADETSRFLTTTLAPSDARPEARRFKNPDVVGRARAIRSDVLRDVVGIVAGYLHSGDSAPVDGGSRFVQWDKLVRQPIAWAGGVDVAQTFANNAEAAEHLQALRALLHALRQHFGAVSFSARDVVSAAEAGYLGPDGFGDRADTYRLRDALEALNCRDVRSTKSVGRGLSSVVGRVVHLDDEAVRLSGRVDRNKVGSFAVESVRGLRAL